MPWKARTALEEKQRFAEEWQTEHDCFAELCRKYGVSRPTGYKWIQRFVVEGDDGLRERSRAPHVSPQAMSADTQRQVLEVRLQHPRWGPRKLRAYLQGHAPEQPWPAASSIAALLSREGLAQPRPRRRRTPPGSEPLAHAAGPNQVWCADFKGWFVCGDGYRCDPLTITDAYSRYLLHCRAVKKTDGPHVRGVFETVFREWGLPEAIRTDNGPPFAAPAPAGLSRLGIWWVRLGIRHERIQPGCPQQNGRHERMHQTLKQETASPPAATLRRQQQEFQRFQREYNQERPHEALAYRPPASLYMASPRLYPARVPEPVYPTGATLRAVATDGQMRWYNRRVFLSKTLAGESVGVVALEQDFYELYYGPLLLGWYDERENVFARDTGPRAGRAGRMRQQQP